MKSALQRGWGVLKNALIIIGVLISFGVILEIIRAYETLNNLHPAAGMGFIGVILALLIYLLLQAVRIVKYKRIVQPPAAGRRNFSAEKYERRYRLFLNELSERFSGNELVLKYCLEDLENFSERKEHLSFSGKMAAEAEKEAIEFERQYISPIMEKLDREAEKVVSDNVGLVTMGTALSPYKSLDLYIVLARNFRMVNKIIELYRTRPSFRETAGIYYDILKVVAAVNILNAMDNLWAGVGRHIPLVGNYGAAVSEGLFSGLLTSVTGHAAMDRCRTFRPLPNEELAVQYRGKIKNWAGDIFDILRRHLLERINPFKKDEDAITEEEMLKAENFWNKISKKLRSPFS